MILTVGLPGCLKTTKAKEWRAMHPAGVLLARDDFRAMLRGDDGRRHVDVDPEADAEIERLVSRMQMRCLDVALARGLDVLIHDTNLNPEYRVPLIEVAHERGHPVDAWDFTGADPRGCIVRVERRRLHGGRWVPADVILDLYTQWIISGRANPAHQPGIGRVVKIPVPYTSVVLDDVAWTSLTTTPPDSATLASLRERYGQ
jgi:predicted kinase